MTRRGWCPGLYDPMESGDGLLVRVKPPGARLDAAQTLRMADAVIRHGNGQVELTQRGYLQIRGLHAKGVAPFAEAMVAAELAEADPARERRRRVIASPPIDAQLVAAIEAMQADSADWDALPQKFAISLNGLSGDIHVCGAETGIGAIATEVPPLTAIPRLSAAILRRGGGRAATHDAAAVFAEAGLPARPAAAAPDPAAGLGVMFGQITMEMLRELGGMWLTPDRSVIPDAMPDAATIARLGLIVDPTDPRRAMYACAGKPACASASVTTRADAQALAGLAASLHVSGCAKGCAHPGAAAVTLVGREGRYDLVRHGRAGDEPSLRGLTLADVAAALAA